MDKSKLVKLGMVVLGAALSIGSTLVNDKVKNDQLEETITKKVAEVLEK